MIATLRKLLIQDDASIDLPAGDDKMNQLFDQDDEPEKVATPKIKRPRGRAAEAFVNAVVEVRVPVPSVMLDAPEESGKAAPVEATGATPAEAGERSLLMLRCSDLAPRIEIDALPWLVAVLQTEREARGVPLIKKRADSGTVTSGGTSPTTCGEAAIMMRRAKSIRGPSVSSSVVEAAI
jgi:hypothetical protein